MDELQTEFRRAEAEPRIQVPYLYLAVKRLFDLLAATLALVVTSPIILVSMILIMIEDRSSSPLYTQERCGKHGETFRMYKLRSMVTNAEQMLGCIMDQNEMDGPVFKIANDPRITRVGKWLRKLNIDELPQFVNVIKGDMSLVGPRPALPGEVAQYDSYAKRRLSVKPGITCYWQITPNRNSLLFSEWMDLDMKYIQERSILVDLDILFRTALTILRLQGI